MNSRKREKIDHEFRQTQRTQDIRHSECIGHPRPGSDVALGELQRADLGVHRHQELGAEVFLLLQIPPRLRARLACLQVGGVSNSTFDTR